MLVPLLTLAGALVASAGRQPAAETPFSCGTILPLPADREDIARRVRVMDDSNPFARAQLQEIEIPVWFHIITAEGQGQVAQDVLDAQLKRLNDAFRPGGFSFYLAGVRPRENPAWWSMTLGSPEEAAAKKELHVSGMLNVYVARPRGMYGWATWPWLADANPIMDGVVLHYGALPGGSRAPYNLGCTLVHETAHWLGVLHTFSSGCDGAGDEVDDTPSQTGPTSGCPTDPPDTCPLPGLDAFHNYMDYSYDECRTEFTPGQMARARTMVITYRRPLLAKADFKRLNLAALLDSDAAASQGRPQTPEPISLTAAVFEATEYAKTMSPASGAPVSAMLRGAEFIVEFKPAKDQAEPLIVKVGANGVVTPRQNR